jgi:hypothetical protein
MSLLRATTVGFRIIATSSILARPRKGFNGGEC